MDAVLYLKELQRLETTDSKLYSQELMMTDKTFEDRVAFVEQWVKEHPRKTRMQDFLEKFPNAPVTQNGEPEVCCKYIGYIKECLHVPCTVCWNQPLEDVNMSKNVKFVLNGCDISFIAEAPEDITLKQLLVLCDRIEPEWCACGICTAEKEGCVNSPVEIKFTYDSVEKVDENAPCTIEEDDYEENDC